jgi:hypothetical protein
LIRFGWPRLNDDFKQTIKRLKRLSRIVDSEAEAVRLRTDKDKNTELLAAMEMLKDSTINDKLPCYYIPFGINEQFYGRDDILQQVKRALDREEGDRQCKSLVLYGLGGVGKTKTALQYVNNSRDRFDAIFWISADNSIKLMQSFLEVSRRLGLSPENDDAQDAVAAISKVKIWLSETRELLSPLDISRASTDCT